MRPSSEETQLKRVKGLIFIKNASNCIKLSIFSFVRDLEYDLILLIKGLFSKNSADYGRKIGRKSEKRS